MVAVVNESKPLTEGALVSFPVCHGNTSFTTEQGIIQSIHGTYAVIHGLGGGTFLKALHRLVPVA